MSEVILLNGVGSELIEHLDEPLDLNGSWVIGLTSFSTYHTIPNIDSSNNSIIIGDKIIQIPTGSYELEDIEDYLNRVIQPEVIEIRPNLNTLQVAVKCSKTIVFPKTNTLSSVLGFGGGATLKSSIEHRSEKLVDIFKVNSIRLECNIAKGTFFQGRRSRSIFEFFPNVDPGQKIYLTPNPVIYHKVFTNRIENISVKILDQNNQLVDFRGEKISIHLHLKRI